MWITRKTYFEHFTRNLANSVWSSALTPNDLTTLPTHAPLDFYRLYQNLSPIGDRLHHRLVVRQTIADLNAWLKAHP
jgi:hypothetical protein